MRIFTAFSLPSEVKSRLLEDQKSFETSLRGGVRWTTAGQLHVTLEFLGDLPSQNINNLASIIQQAAREQKSFHLAMGEYRFFPNEINPRVLVRMAYETESRGLNDFRTKVHEQLQAEGFKVDEKLWLPHVTLGRLPPALPNNKFKLPKVSNGPDWVVNSIEIFSSVLDSKGSQHTKLHSFAFHQ